MKDKKPLLSIIETSIVGKPKKEERINSFNEAAEEEEESIEESAMADIMDAFETGDVKSAVAAMKQFMEECAYNNNKH